MNATRAASRASALLALILALSAGCARLLIPADDAPLRPPDGYFPRDEWRTSTPEAQGLDSQALVALFDAIKAKRLPIHSLHIVRYEHLVLDAYFYPFARGQRHDVASVTKSVTTTLIGLALERGVVAGLDAPVYPLLSAQPPADALISRSTGLAAEDFARQALFALLGITNLRWPREPQSITQGAGDLQLLPTDLLRLGYLFLRNGEWNARQIVPREWIAQATRRQVDTPSSEGYGFGWWVSRDIPGMYQAAGRGGQRLIVWPAKDIVVVMTGGGFDPGEIAPFLLRALKSNEALPDQPGAHRRLIARVSAASEPVEARGSAPPLPERAAAISGREYALDPNPLGVRSVQFRFLHAVQVEAHIRLRDSEMVVPVGLDGAYRFGIDPASNGLVAGRGQWAGPDEFVLEIDTIARINHFTVMQRLEADRLHGQVRERAGLIDTPISGRARR